VFLGFALVGNLTCLAYSQELASTAMYPQPALQGENQFRPLTSVLQELSVRYKIRFDYEKKALDGKRVNVRELTETGSNLEGLLNRLLEPLQLTFEKFNSNNYLIYPVREKKEAKTDVGLTGQPGTDTASIESLPSVLPRSPLPMASPALAVTGRVTDEKGEGLPGVNVLVKGTNLGTTTNADGDYNLSVTDAQANGTLVFSSIGYVTQEVAINNRTTVNVTLASDIKTLGEVVVVGYGAVRKKDLTGSVATVDVGESSKQVTATSPLQTLQGRVAGVDVQSASGAPGAGVNVRIRGVGTINNNNPLYVVDGVLTGGSLNDINPNDIQSIQILKDASAAAIYGSRAANGVVIITTKQGSSGKPRFSVSGYYGLSQPTNFYDLVSAEQYAQLNNYARLAANRKPLTPNLSAEEGGTFDPSVNTDWQQELYGGARPIQKYDLSASGGSDNGTYYVSLGYFNQEGVLLNTGIERYTARINTSFKKGIFRIGQNLNIARSGLRNASSGLRDAVVEAVRIPSTIPVYNPDNVGGFDGAPNELGLAVSNPVAHQLLKNNRSDGTALLGNVFAELDLFSGLQYKLNLGGDADFNHRKYYIPAFNMGRFDNNQLNSLSESRGTAFTWLMEHTLNYNRSFGSHDLGVLGGFSAQSSRESDVSGSVQDIPGNGSLQVLSAGTVPGIPGGSVQEYALQSYFGRLTYGFKGKYLLTANFRTDGSSRFAPGNRWITNPSVSAAWRVSDEGFFGPLRPLVGDLKIRASYGSLGNQNVGNYAYSSALNMNSNYPFGGPADPGISSPAAVTRGYTITNYANPNLRWETTITKDVGLDAALFNNRISITADYWERLTEDMITPLPIPYSVGIPGDAPNFPYNVGSIRNRGFEFSATYNKEQGDFKFNVSANFSTLKNEVLQLTGNEDDAGIPGGYIESSIYNTTLTRVGTEIGAFYLYDIVGIYQNEDEVNTIHPIRTRKAAPGDLIYRDVNGDGILDSRDLVYMGSAIPKFQGGLNFSGSYKGIDLNLFLQGVTGVKVYDAMRYFIESGIGDYNYSTRLLNAWTPENPNTDVPRLVHGDPGNNARLASERWLQDGSYLRLRNVQLGYTLPAGLTRFVEGSSVRFYVTGTNLLTFTKYTGYDPEVGRDGVTNRGVDRGNYPMSKMFVGGLQVNF